MVLNFSPADLADSADSSQIFVVFECAFVNCKNRRDPWEINSGYKFPADFRGRRRKSAEIPSEWKYQTFIEKNISAAILRCLRILRELTNNNFPQISDSYWDEKWKMRNPELLRHYNVSLVF